MAQEEIQGSRAEGAQSSPAQPQDLNVESNEVGYVALEGGEASVSAWEETSRLSLPCQLVWVSLPMMCQILVVGGSNADETRTQEQELWG